MSSKSSTGRTFTAKIAGINTFRELPNGVTRHEKRIRRALRKSGRVGIVGSENGFRNGSCLFASYVSLMCGLPWWKEHGTRTLTHLKGIS
jgi:hypothetical protein